MRIFVYEHVCGGGMALERQLPPALLEPGVAMLAAVVHDLMAWGASVVTSLDNRIKLRLDGAQVTWIKEPAQIDVAFHQLALAADAVLVIAPESQRTLENWSLRLVSSGVISLGCTPGAIALCGDKLRLSRHLHTAGIPVPPTVPVNFVEELAAHPKVVIKPRWGAGCEDTYLCRPIDAAPLAAASPEAIAQPYVLGTPASVSLIVRPDGILTLLPGEQKIEYGAKLAYLGGRIPLNGDLGARAVKLAQRAAAAVPGLHGWVGVDLILGDDPRGDQVIEINPRLTMSYVGLRRICTTNLASLLLDGGAALQGPRGPLWSDLKVSFDWAGRCQIRGLKEAR